MKIETAEAHTVPRRICRREAARKSSKERGAGRASAELKNRGSFLWGCYIVAAPFFSFYSCEKSGLQVKYYRKRKYVWP